MLLLLLIMKTNLGKLYLGDSLEILKIIPNKSIDLILTDPPYLYPDIAKKLKNKEKHIEYNLKKCKILIVLIFNIKFGKENLNFYKVNLLIVLIYHHILKNECELLKNQIL
ncbi:DNA methylase [Spiroplasma kunkelii CR2-3x]|uniref:DNA methylase n=1 Tax=Spiroplasma kunkelii CR2-3x TaxID=273035 RepID=A0A0K2JGA4_SPIKU|nr:DNA methylase [Spiroplasma kunkelii CR2-3x]